MFLKDHYYLLLPSCSVYSFSVFLSSQKIQYVIFIVHNSEQQSLRSSKFCLKIGLGFKITRRWNYL